MDKDSRYPIRRNIGILEYWVKRNKSNSYSKKLVKLVTKKTKQITKNPFIYKSTNFKNTRVASMGNFGLYYKIINEQIVITAFWDNRQDPKKHLEILQNEK